MPLLPYEEKEPLDMPAIEFFPLRMDPLKESLSLSLLIETSAEPSLE